MGWILALLKALPAISRIIDSIKLAYRAWQLKRLEDQIRADRDDIAAAFKLKEGQEAMTIEDARERAKRLDEIFRK